MNTQLYYMVARQRGVELRLAAERTRLAREASGQRRHVRDGAPVTRLSVNPRRVSPRDMTVLEPERAMGGAR